MPMSRRPSRIALSILDMAADIEVCQLGTLTVPRIFNGLWQLSSNAWGNAPASKIRREMARHVEHGFYAFDMADHYGSAELLYGDFRTLLENPTQVIGATKWCVFRPVKATREFVAEGLHARMTRMKTSRVDLLQVHWQDYSTKEYLVAFQHLVDFQKEGLITALGLCNFDSIHADEICTACGPGVIVSNQVQFSLIDVRPLYGMAEVCQKHNMKLLTYGTICGGFLSDRWLGKAEPDSYSTDMTPSQRKYLDIILSAWGTWELFQSLLSVLRQIGDRHGGVSIANVATRWVLDHPFVGAVLIGTRMGVSEHVEDNHRVFTFQLSDTDRTAIDGVLDQSRRHNLISTIGDCGAEYRGN
ncbi:Aldo/keto reductase [Sistotremastrum niveocremeum HHB9708]|uniref:Aldo/keto reductase n=2 Tax=Sistotremastraceae TaxID=3402574 RepID=A0A164X536_9AGAM|nr:Aldo/keto reductase [Sistotremastrum niveocremeum HHB9708]KZT37904.1 Aldo/keto reductase [Sistotremastrum suecicum HHB10207 ss-3]